MTLQTLLEKTGARASHQLEQELNKVDAVYDDELWAILKHYGLLDALDRGDLVCYRTGVPLTRDNVGGLVGSPSGPKLIADTYGAAREVEP